MSEIQRDISFETLAQMCSIDIEQLTKSSRGELNGALKQLRDTHPDLADLELAIVIEDKARSYRKVMPDVILTPSALVKHWAALEGMRAQQEAPRAYPERRDPYGCQTCNGLRLVPSSDRPPAPPYDQAYAPCPDCNPKGLEIAQRELAKFERLYFHSPAPPPEETLRELGEVVHARPRRSPLLP